MRNRLRSIEWRLSGAFALLALILMAGSLFALEQLGNFDKQSAEIRDQLLQKTRFVGDLNNFTSDFRTAETSRLLSLSARDADLVGGEIARLDLEIDKARENYEHLRHDAAEQALFDAFSTHWNAYRRLAAQVLAFVAADQQAYALTLLRTSSKNAYEAVEDALNSLTALTNDRARVAGQRAATALEQLRWFSRGAILLGGAIVLVGLIYVRWAITKPLLGLANSMRRLSMTETDVAIPGIHRQDEIGEMARAAVVFRTNAVELLVSQSGLANQAAMLAEKLAHEQKLTQLQRDFVSMASHELRTPLTIIDGQAQRLINLNGRISQDDTVERARRIRVAVDKTNHLISRMLNSASILDGGLNLYFHPQPMDLMQVLREVCATYGEIAPPTTIVESFQAKAIPIFGDERLLFQAFGNILANALKYSPPGTPVHVRAACVHGQAVVSVADTGIGIPMVDIARIFERFCRGSNVAGTVGTGIGLFLVKTVVDLHHGAITAENGTERGAVFEITLPLRAESLEGSVSATSNVPSRAD